MSDAPITDWDLIYRWEWFRRTVWQPTFRAEILGDGGGPARAFCDLAKLIGVDVALDAGCGLGRTAICMHEMGLNVIGADRSRFAVEKAAELATAENIPLHTHCSDWAGLPQNMPHQFGAIYCDTLTETPEWDALGAALVGFYHTLKPGGFLLFTGVEEGEHGDAGAARLFDEWNRAPHEYVEWVHKDGAVSCAKLLQRTQADDFIDERILYVINDNNIPRLEDTILRKPYYWTWDHFVELARTAGFCHLETRVYERYGKDGGPLKVNVAWRSKDGQGHIDTPARTQPYQD